PEGIAFLQALGGSGTSRVGIWEFHKLRDAAHAGAAPATRALVGGFGAAPPSLDRLTMGALGFEVFLGALTFTGSIMAFGKLQGVITGAPVTWKGQNMMNIGLFFGTLALLVYQVVFPDTAPQWLFFTMIGAGLSLCIISDFP